MKKIISRSVTTMLIAATLVSSAFSQDLAVNTKKIVSQSETKVAPGETRYINDVNSKNGQGRKNHRKNRTMNRTSKGSSNTKCVPIDPKTHPAKIHGWKTHMQQSCK